MSSWAAPEGAKGCWQWAALNTALYVRKCLCVCVSVTFLHKTKKEKATNSYSLECICVGEAVGAVWVCGGDYPLFVFDFAFFHLLPFEFFLFLLVSESFFRLAQTISLLF